MNKCVIFGGSGYIGTHLTQLLLNSGMFSRIHIADITPCSFTHQEGISYSQTDVREAIPDNLIDFTPTWIFNFAAIHREPGHLPHEYFVTNIQGARNVCAFATATGCTNIFFISSIAIYGPTITPTDESKLAMPSTPYGSSKYSAELIHQIWQAENSSRRLIITRPGVVYGPGDPGNIMRMIKAIKDGYFVFPGSKSIHKSYAYIYGFLESIIFTLGRKDSIIIYNYVETPTEKIGEIAEKVKSIFNLKSPIISLPTSILVPISVFLRQFVKQTSPLHPVRVRKAATPTHIVPKELISMGFPFKYDFESSIKHWHSISPEDFG